MLKLTTCRSAYKTLAGSRSTWRRWYSLQRPEGDYENEVFSMLEKDFQPSSLLVKDISGGCGSMFAINIESEKFRGLSPVKQQQLVYKTLGDELTKWHGLQLKTKAPKKE